MTKLNVYDAAIIIVNANIVLDKFFNIYVAREMIKALKHLRNCTLSQIAYSLDLFSIEDRNRFLKCVFIGVYTHRQIIT